MNSKAITKISLNLVVILITIFIVLGIIFIFLNTQLDSINKSSISVKESTKNKLINDLQDTDQKIVLQEKTLFLNEDQEKEFLFAVTNKHKDNLLYSIEIKPNNALSIRNNKKGYSIKEGEAGLHKIAIEAKDSGTHKVTITINEETQSGKKPYTTTTLTVNVK